MINYKETVTALICNSNMFVPYVLSEVLSNHNTKYIIMSDIESIVLFLNELNLDNAEILLYRQSSLRNLYVRRSEIKKLVKKYNIIQIIFFHTEFGGIINWFLINMSRKTKIYFCKVFDQMPYPKANGIKARKFWFKNLLLTGDSVEVLDRGFSFVPSLRPSFFKRIGAIPYNIDINYILIKNLLCRQRLGEPKAKILLLTGSTVSSGIVEENEYTRKTDLLISAIGIDSIVSKCHPRFDDIFGKEKELESLPKYIPGNLLIDSFEVFIGNHSTLIAEAAIAGKLAISLVDYYKQTNPEQTLGFKALFNDRLKGKGVIHYPKTVDEIIELINSIN